jgi:hypothetical protein
VDPVIYYASHTGTGRNLDAMRRTGVRLLLSRAAHHWRRPVLDFHYCLDPGTWADTNAGRPFDEAEYEKMIEALGRGADFVVLPDIIADARSLDLSMRWMNRVRAIADLVLIAVQDGMSCADLEPLVGPNVGVFLGGSTAWKLKTAPMWGEFCAPRGVHYHFARVNTARRMHFAIACGATSGDGSSISRYAVTASLLAGARQQLDLFTPRQEPVP